MINHQDLRKLAEHNSERSISVLIPTHRAGQEVKESKDKILFKNQLQEVEKTLRAYDLEPREIEAELKPFNNLLDDNEFWFHQDHGLAVYKSGDDFHVYHLPESMPEFNMVGERFYITPIIPVVQHNKPFYLLELNQKEVKLFKADRYNYEQVEIDAITPQRLEEVVGFDLRERTLQLHSAGNQGGESLYHGHGAGEDIEKNEIRKFVAAVDEGIMSVLNGKKLPLVVSSVEYLFPMFKDVSKYPHIHKDFIKGSRKETDAKKVHQEAVSLLKGYFENEKSEKLAKFNELAGTGKTAQSIENILPEAMTGRVEHLILQFPERIFGEFDNKSREINRTRKQQPGSDELLNRTATEVVKTDGTVELMSDEEFPVEDTYALAVFRY